MVSWINKKNNKYQNGQQKTPQVKAKEDNKRQKQVNNKLFFVKKKILQQRQKKRSWHGMH